MIEMIEGHLAWSQEIWSCERVNKKRSSAYLPAPIVPSFHRINQIYLFDELPCDTSYN